MKKMNISTVLLTFFVLLHAQEWEIKRNPFVVSKSYMERTGKHYLLPKDTYGFLDIKVKGIFYKKGVKSILMDLGDRGFMYMKEGEKRDVDTPDILTVLKVVKIEDDHIFISINDGEAIRHEIQ